MTIALGICCSTDGSDDWQALAYLGQPLVHVALTKTHSDVPQWHRKQGRRVMGVVAAETFQAFGGYSILEPGDHHQILTLTKQRWGALLDWIEIGNEPDDPGASSSGMPAATWENLLTTACAVFHANGNHDAPQLISGGLSTGQPNYLNGISIPPCFMFGLHDYNSRLRGWPDAGYGFHELEEYIEAYRPWWSRLRGLCFSEWGTTNDDPTFASEYIRRWLAIVREHPEVKLAAWFALNDKQSVTRHGLIRTDGVRKPQFSVYKKELQMPPTFKLGFKDYADAHPKIGKALSEERYFSAEQDVSVQIAEGGVLFYAQDTNSVVCVPTGEPGK